jgi:Holliday junction resolvasome RuvABC endonuclease subunit
VSLNILGLDLSLTGTGVAISSGPRTISYKKKTGDREEPRLDYIRTQILTTVETETIGLVVMEGLAFGSQMGKQTERAGLAWLVRIALWKRDIPYAVVPPTCLKQYLTGKGNASKEEMVIEAVRAFPQYVFKDNNQADALTLLAMGYDRIGSPLITRPAKNRQSLNKVAWPEGL